jgi:quinolinate synthase
MPVIDPARPGSGDHLPANRSRPSVGRTAASARAESDEELRDVSEQNLLKEIERLRRDRGALILAHNYQIPAIQDLADVVGDSLQLAEHAATSGAQLIVCCGVRFMAETVALLCASTRVLIPDLEADCSLAATAPVDEVRAWKAEHPDAVVVAYVNTTAEVKAEADYCCTSANAVEVVLAIPPDREILFLPDMHLGLYVEHVTGRPLHRWLGECHVHADIREANVVAQIGAHPGADVLLHPECGCVGQCLLALADGDLPADRTFIVGTGGMVARARESHAPVTLVGTEIGMLHRLRKEAPGKTFLPIKDGAICDYMKTITLAKLYRTLRDDIYEVTVPEPVAGRARLAIERMLAVT